MTYHRFSILQDPMRPSLLNGRSPKITCGLFQNPIQQVAQAEIDQPEEDGHEQDRDQDNQCIVPQFLARGPTHFFQLGPAFLKIATCGNKPSLDPRTQPRDEAH